MSRALISRCDRAGDGAYPAAAARALAVLLGCSLLLAACSRSPASDRSEQPARHRYIIERNFAPGALDGLDAALKARVNANNARYHVEWLMSYVNSDRTKTYCIYTAPDESAVRKAAAANGLPIDTITEVPATLLPR